MAQQKKAIYKISYRVWGSEYWPQTVQTVNVIASTARAAFDAIKEEDKHVQDVQFMGDVDAEETL